MNLNRLCRSAVAAALAIPLTACAGTFPSLQEPSSPAPDWLVGRWNGGSSGSSLWYLTVQPDGSYELRSEYFDDADEGRIGLTDEVFTMNSSTPESDVAKNMAVSNCDYQIEQIPDMYGIPGALQMTLCGVTYSYVKSAPR